MPSRRSKSSKKGYNTKILFGKCRSDGITKEREEFLRKRQRANPELKELITRLENLIPNTIVVAQSEDDLDRLLKDGKIINAPARLYEMKSSHCHENVSTIYDIEPERFVIQTGWALSEDGLWRQHSWIFDQRWNEIIETTKLRVKYWGIALTDEEIKEFMHWNEPYHKHPIHIKKLYGIKDTRINGKKGIYGTCVNLSMSFLEKHDPDDAEEITMKEFLKNCDVSEMKFYNQSLEEAMKEFPQSYTFWKFPDKDVYFFTWSAIEHYFK